MLVWSEAQEPGAVAGTPAFHLVILSAPPPTCTYAAHVLKQLEEEGAQEQTSTLYITN